MIARVWRGATAAADAEPYLEYLKRTGAASCRSLPGNRGVEILRRIRENRAEFTFISYWDSLDAIKSFAGPDVQAAVFYPEDDRFLIERDLSVGHFDVVLNQKAPLTSSLHD